MFLPNNLFSISRCRVFSSVSSLYLTPLWFDPMQRRPFDIFNIYECSQQQGEGWIPSPCFDYPYSVISCYINVGNRQIVRS